MVFYATFNNISVISRGQLTLFMPSWVSPVLGWGSEVSCPRTLPRKNPQDPVRLEPRTPGLWVKHFTTEPRRTPNENGRRFFKRVENTVGKGGIAHYKQFLLFPQCFQKTCTADTWKPGLVWERVNMYGCMCLSCVHLWNMADKIKYRLLFDYS